MNIKMTLTGATGGVAIVPPGAILNFRTVKGRVCLTVLDPTNRGQTTVHFASDNFMVVDLTEESSNLPRPDRTSPVDL